MTDSQAGERVRIRDVAPADADAYDEIEHLERSDGGFNDFGRPWAPVDREALAKGPLRGELTGRMVIERLEDGRIIGSVGWHQVAYGANAESRAWNFGIELLAEARGQGYGTEAQRLVAEYLFRTTSANRVEASTDVENVAEQRALEKAGFRREGIARAAQFRGGVFHDLVVYAKVRSDPR